MEIKLFLKGNASIFEERNDERPFQKRAWSCVTSYYSPLLWGSHHTVDTVNPAVGMILCSSMHTKVHVLLHWGKHGKSILQVPDTGTRILDNTWPFLCSSIVSFWITLAHSKEHKYHIFWQYWYTRNVPVFTNTGTFQYLGPQVYFFRKHINYLLPTQIIIFNFTCELF